MAAFAAGQGACGDSGAGAAAAAWAPFKRPGKAAAAAAEADNDEAGDYGGVVDARTRGRRPRKAVAGLEHEDECSEVVDVGTQRWDHVSYSDEDAECIGSSEDGDSDEASDGDEDGGDNMGMGVAYRYSD